MAKSCSSKCTIILLFYLSDDIIGIVAYLAV